MANKTQNIQRTLHYLAKKLKPYQTLINLITLAALLSFIWLITQPFEAKSEEKLFIAALIFVWSLLINLLIFAFLAPPSIEKKNASFLTRWRYRINKAYYYLLTLIFTFAVIASLFISYRLIKFGYIAN